MTDLKLYNAVASWIPEGSGVGSAEWHSCDTWGWHIAGLPTVIALVTEYLHIEHSVEDGDYEYLLL